MAGESRIRRAGRVAGSGAARAPELARSVRSSARRFGSNVRFEPSRRMFIVIGAGLGMVIAGLVAGVAYRDARSGVSRVIDETRERASSTVHDARDRFAAVATKLQRAA